MSAPWIFWGLLAVSAWLMIRMFVVGRLWRKLALEATWQLQQLAHSVETGSARALEKGDVVNDAAAALLVAGPDGRGHCVERMTYALVQQKYEVKGIERALRTACESGYVVTTSDGKVPSPDAVMARLSGEA